MQRVHVDSEQRDVYGLVNDVFFHIYDLYASTEEVQYLSVSASPWESYIGSQSVPDAPKPLVSLSRSIRSSLTDFLVCS